MSQHVHFIGIGGIGVSALAKYYLQKGWSVSGSDLALTEITKQMKDLGAVVHIGKPKASLITKKIQKVIFSPAVSATHPERVAARKNNIAEFSYPQALGELTREHFTIAVSGTHGKSTTSSMLGLLLTKAGLDPTVIIGTKLKEFGNSNCRVGTRKTVLAQAWAKTVFPQPILVIEADEHFASFLNYRPQIIILTSLEADHLDFYKTLGNLTRTFRKYVELLGKDGIIVANKDEKNIRKILQDTTHKVVWYSKKQKEAKKLKNILSLPGEHNIANAQAALSAARLLHVPDKKSFAALSSFKGSWRRFEVFNVKCQMSNVKYTLVSDYGHHPTEIRVTVEAAREKWPKKNIWLIYQPHQYQRTFYLFKDFVKVLSTLPVQKLFLMDIYDVAGREEGSIYKKVSSVKLVEEIQKKKPPFEVLYTKSAMDAKKYLLANVKHGDIVMVMGAGDIYRNLTLELIQHHF